jgi:hypothetical protein
VKNDWGTIGMTPETKKELEKGEQEMIEIRNAIIKRTFLGIEDHGIFTAVITLDYGSSQQGFGQHNLEFKDYGIAYLRKILEAVGVNEWEELQGQTVRVKCEHTKVYAIGNIIQDKWFEPERLNEPGNQKRTLLMKLSELEILHDKLLLGTASVKDLNDTTLLAIRKPALFHRTFMVPLEYRPSFDVFELCQREIERRREENLTRKA